jgi:DNA-binding CsgD family transcriptional regulator
MTVHLSPREREVLQWAARGKSAVDTGVILGISPHTVTFHRRGAMKKFDVTNLRQAVAAAVAAALIDPGERW